MKQIVKLRISNADSTRLGHMDEAYSLIGGTELPEQDQKPFGRIRGNDFSVDDAEAALAIVHRQATEYRRRAVEDQVFLDPKLQATWADAMIGNAGLAIRQAEQFMSDLRQDLAQTA